MSRIVVAGCGAVSSAGWGVEPLRCALRTNLPLPAKPLQRPGWAAPIGVRPVPPPPAKPPFLNHARLRRSSPITQYAMAAALEALGGMREIAQSKERLGLILCVMAGCVSYSRRFYAETWRDPATASPLVFPETVFNAPASHIAAVLGTTGINYTLVGDSGTFLTGLALAADWLENDQVDGCLVIGAEELDWLVADAFRLFARGVLISEGAGAVYLRKSNIPSKTVQLEAVTDAHLFLQNQSRAQAARAARSQLPSSGDLLCDSRVGHSKLDAPETRAWHDWASARLSPKMILGEGLAASGAWQCVAAIDALDLRDHSSALVAVTGSNQQAIGAQFVTRTQKRGQKGDSQNVRSLEST